MVIGFLCKKFLVLGFNPDTADPFCNRLVENDDADNDCQDEQNFHKAPFFCG